MAFALENCWVSAIFESASDFQIWDLLSADVEKKQLNIRKAKNWEKSIFNKQFNDNAEAFYTRCSSIDISSESKQHVECAQVNL